MDLGLAGRRALVTASTEGLGLAAARALAAEGARVAVSGRRPERVTEVAGSLPEGVGVAGDLRAEDGPAAVVAAAVEQLGGLDILVVNTGGASPGGMVDKDAQAWDAGYASVLRPALALARAAVPALRRSVGGAGWCS